MLFGLNSEQMKSLLGRILTFVGGLLTAWGATKYGWIAAHWETISGIILSIASLVWSVKDNTKSGVIQAAANLPEVSKVVVNSAALAKATTAPGAKVTTS